MIIDSFCSRWSITNEEAVDLNLDFAYSFLLLWHEQGQYQKRLTRANDAINASKSSQKSKTFARKPKQHPRK